jgi:hypothetical protein
MRLPYWLLRLLPMWDYICPACRREVPKNSHECPHCHEKYPLPVRVPPKVLKDSKALEDYVHKHIFPKVSRAHRDYLAQFFTTIFESGWEDSNGSDVTDNGVWDGYSGSPTVVESPVYKGNYAMQCNANEWVYKTLGSAQPILFGRLYFRTANETGENEQDRAAIIRFSGTSESDTITALYIWTFSGVFQWRLYYWAGGIGNSHSFSDPMAEVDKWYCIELKAVIDGSVGEYRVWFDDVEKVTLTGLDTTGKGDVAGVLVGQRFLTGVAPTTYSDCVVVADAYIGPEEGTLVEVADSLELAEAVLRNKTLILSDSLGLADSFYGNKSLLLSDSASLSELVTVIIGEVMKYVTDSVSSADLVSTPSRVLRALEAIGAADNVAVNKVLQITETVSLAEIVEVGVGGVKKTRLFLILGDLAVQLTGD